MTSHMSTSQDILTIIQSIKAAPDDKKIRAFDEITPLIEIILMNTQVVDKIISDFSDTKNSPIADHINAIEHRSEESANKIIDAALEISQNLLSVPDSQKKSIEAAINKIYEGCNFQDLVSQHAKEINQSVKHFNEELVYIRQILNATDKKQMPDRPIQDSRENSHLLNGPKTNLTKTDEKI